MGIQRNWTHPVCTLTLLKNRKALFPSFVFWISTISRTIPPIPWASFLFTWLLPLHILQPQTGCSDLSPYSRPSQPPLWFDHFFMGLLQSLQLCFFLALHQSVLHMQPVAPFKWRSDHVTDPNPSHYLHDKNLTLWVLSDLMPICPSAPLPSVLF